MRWNWKDFWIKALIRAVRTFAQTFVSMIGVGAAFNEVDWLRALSVSGVAFVLSILTSLATGLPEVETKPPAEEKAAEDEEANG
ncbi:MAG: holin [Verrucomicrobia bacterium]|nr:holin [Verrucomicrobiota bacterium]